jgi:hypothetical protein
MNLSAPKSNWACLRVALQTTRATLISRAILLKCVTAACAPVVFVSRSSVVSSSSLTGLSAVSLYIRTAASRVMTNLSRRRRAIVATMTACLLSVSQTNRGKALSRCDSRAAYPMARRFSAEDLPRPSIGNNVEGDRLSFVKAMYPGAFDRADLQPLHGSLRHITLPSGNCAKKAALARGRFVRDLEKVVSPTREARRGQVVRPKLDCAVWSIAVWAARIRSKQSWPFAWGALALQPAIKDLFVKD